MTKGEAMKRAVALLEEKNVPPAVCDGCGTKFYLFVEEWMEFPLARLLCEACRSKDDAASSLP